MDREMKSTDRLFDLLLDLGEFPCDPALLLLLLLDVLLDAIPPPTFLLHLPVLLGQLLRHLVNLPLVVEQAEELQEKLLLGLSTHHANNSN